MMRCLWSSGSGRHSQRCLARVARLQEVHLGLGVLDGRLTVGLLQEVPRWMATYINSSGSVSLTIFLLPERDHGGQGPDLPLVRGALDVEPVAL